MKTIEHLWISIFEIDLNNIDDLIENYLIQSFKENKNITYEKYFEK